MIHLACKRALKFNLESILTFSDYLFAFELLLDLARDSILCTVTQIDFAAMIKRYQVNLSCCLVPAYKIFEFEIKIVLPKSKYT